MPFCRIKVDGEGVFMNTEESITNKNFGIVVAVVLLIAGCIMFFFWDSFGNEILLKLLSLPFIFFGLAGLGNEISDRSNDGGAANMGIGLAFIFTGLIIKSALTIVPNLIILFVILLGMMFIGVSISNLITSDYKPVDSSSQIFYRIVIIIGQIAGSVLSLLELIDFLL